MLTITNSVTPEQLNKKQKDMGRLVGFNVVENLKQNPQVLQNHNQIGRKKHLFYQNQLPGIKQALV